MKSGDENCAIPWTRRPRGRDAGPGRPEVRLPGGGPAPRTATSPDLARRCDPATSRLHLIPIHSRPGEALNGVPDEASTIGLEGSFGASSPKTGAATTSLETAKSQGGPTNRRRTLRPFGASGCRAPARRRSVDAVPPRPASRPQCFHYFAMGIGSPSSATGRARHAGTSSRDGQTGS